MKRLQILSTTASFVDRKKCNIRNMLIYVLLSSSMFIYNHVDGHANLATNNKPNEDRSSPLSENVRIEGQNYLYAINQSHSPSSNVSDKDGDLTRRCSGGHMCNNDNHAVERLDNLSRGALDEHANESRLRISHQSPLSKEVSSKQSQSRVDRQLKLLNQNQANANTKQTSESLEKNQSKRLQFQRFFKSSPKKISLMSFLPSSKYQNLTPSNQTNNKVHSTNNSNLDLIDFEGANPFMDSSLTQQQLIKFGGSESSFDQHHNNQILTQNGLSPSPFFPEDLSRPGLDFLQQNAPQLPPTIGNLQNHQRSIHPVLSLGQVVSPAFIPQPQHHHHHHHVQQHQAGARMPHETFDQSAASTVEHFERIKLHKQKSQTDRLPLFLASGSQEVGNSSALFQTGTTAGLAQKHVPGSTNSAVAAAAAATALSSAAAAALLNERTKNLINQLNLNNQNMANKNTNGLVSLGSIRMNRDTLAGRKQQQQIVDGNTSATSSPALASMLKNAAEAWALNNGAEQTIVVEHDGPTITTVDYGNNPLGPRAPQQAPEDEEETFYTAEEESESEGSNEAKRLVRPNFVHRNMLNRPHSIGYEQQQVNSQLRHSSVPTLTEFFEEHEPNHVKTNLQKETNEEIYMNYPPNPQRDAAIHQHSAKIYPDSINAIKEQNSETGSDGASLRKKGKASSTKDGRDPIERIVKELQELNRKRGKDSSEDKSDFLKQTSSLDDYDDLINKEDDRDAEEERIRIVRKKLLARLRDKAGDRKKSGSSASSFHEHSVKIPLHTLLLAALDRRMSPSEKSQTTISQGGGGLVVDDLNRNLIADGQQDFHQATASMGSLFNVNRLLGALSSSGPKQSEALESLVKQVVEQNLTKLPFDGLSPTGMLLMDNLITLDDLNRKQLVANQSTTPAAEGLDQQEQIETETTRSPAPPTLPNHHNNKVANRSKRRNEFSETAGRSTKGRRAIDVDGDFDVEKKIEEYSNDRNDKPLEPEWMNSQKKYKQRGRHQDGGPHVEFDDEFDDLDKRTRRKMARRKRPNKVDEKTYERNEQQFFDRLQKDTATDNSDVDRTIRDIENSIPNRERKREETRVNRRDGDDGDEGSDSDEGDDSSADDANEGNDVPTRPHRDNSQGSETRTQSSTWRPNMVDEEVRRIENEANAKRQTGRKPDSDDSDGDSGERDDENEAESRDVRTTAQPDGEIKLVFDSNGTRIIQNFAGKP